MKRVLPTPVRAVQARTAPAVAALLLAALVPLAARAALPEQLRTPEPKPAQQGADVIEHLGEQLPAGVRLVDAQGKPTTLGQELAGGKPVLLTLVYFECPMLCSLVLNGLQQGLKQSGLVPGQDYRGVTVSIDPAEGPDRALRHQSAMLRALGAGKPADWPFLTGREPELKTLADAAGFQYRWDAQSKQFAHPAVVFVVTPGGKLSRYLYGIEFKARDLRLAVSEASGGRVGTTLDRVLLTCFRWDSASRHYTFLFGALRAGALLVFFALAALLTVLWRRELRGGSPA